jgi:hypothetical protein
MGEKQAPDWERIEADYRAGVLSLREIAAAHPGVSHVTIKKRADKAGWARDLSAKIKAKAEALVNKAQVNDAVNAGAAVSERATIEANALAVVSVRLEHRADIRRSRALVNKLLQELEDVTDQPGLAEQIVDAMTSDEDESPEVRQQRRRRLQDLLDRVVALPARVGTMKGLAESMRILITLEREAWGLSTDKDPGEGEGGTGRSLSDVERAARLASVLDRAVRAREAAKEGAQ